MQVLQFHTRTKKNNKLLNLHASMLFSSLIQGSTKRVIFHTYKHSSVYVGDYQLGL